MITVVVHIREQEKGTRFTVGSIEDHATEKEKLVVDSLNETLETFAQVSMGARNERPILPS